MKKKKLIKKLNSLDRKLQLSEMKIEVLKSDIKFLIQGSLEEQEMVFERYKQKYMMQELIWGGTVTTFQDTLFMQNMLKRVDHERFIYENGYPKHGWFGCHEGHLNEKMNRADEVNWTWRTTNFSIHYWSSPPKFHNYADPHTQILMNEVTRDAIYADFKNPERNRAFERNKNEGSLEYYRYRGYSATEPFTY